jgi:hypothetical protein
MAGIFDQLIKSKKQVLFVSHHIQPADTKSLELQAAKDILSEVFGTKPEDVDEMIKARISELKGLLVTFSPISSSHHNLLDLGWD